MTSAISCKKNNECKEKKGEGRSQIMTWLCGFFTVVYVSRRGTPEIAQKRQWVRREGKRKSGVATNHYQKYDAVEGKGTKIEP